MDTEFGEVYDNGVKNGTPGNASTDCKTKVPETPTPVNGVCDGASNGKETATIPTKLCTSGIPSNVVDAGTKFTWSCGGVNNGTTVSCEAPKPNQPIVS